MKIAIFILGLLSIVAAAAATLFDLKEKKKLVKFSLAMLVLFSISTLTLQQIKSDNDEKLSREKDSIINLYNTGMRVKADSININTISLLDSTQKLIGSQYDILRRVKQDLKMNQQLIDLTTGGDANIPMLHFSVVYEKQTGRYVIPVGIQNFGDAPLHAVNIILNDYPTVQVEFLETQGKYHVDDIDHSFTLHRTQTDKVIDFGTIAPNDVSVRHYIRALSGTKKIYLAAQISWSNGYYSLLYEIDPSKSPVVVKNARFSRDGVELDIDNYFKKIPNSYWERYGLSKSNVNITPENKFVNFD